MVKPDLTFTNDPEWKEKRLAVWRENEADLKSEFRKKDLKSIEHYLMTGDQVENYRLSDKALLGYFPLCTAEGWDYVYQSLVKKPDLFEYEFYYSTHGNKNMQATHQEKLRYFDYYHPEVFSPVIKSRVPICGEYVEINVDSLKLFDFMAAKLTQMIEKDRFSICFYRKEYFFSTLLTANFDGDDRESQSACNLLKRLMKNACIFQPKVVPKGRY